MGITEKAGKKIVRDLCTMQMKETRIARAQRRQEGIRDFLHEVRKQVGYPGGYKLYRTKAPVVKHWPEFN